MKRLRRGLGDHHPRRPDLGIGQNSPRQLAFLGPPIGRVKHLRRGAKAGQLIQQLIPCAAVCRQAFGGKGHAQTVALGGIDINRIAAHLIANAALIQRSHDITRRSTVQPRVEQAHIRRTGHPRQAQNGQKHRNRGPQNNHAFAGIQAAPYLHQVLQGLSP